MIWVPGIFGFVSHERGSSRVWRRFTEDQHEYPMFPVIENRRQTRIETRDPRRGVLLKGLDTVLAAVFD